SIARIPLPEISVDIETMPRSIHDGASGSSQSGTFTSFVFLVKLIPFVVMPHGESKVSGEPPSPSLISIFDAGTVIGFAIAGAPFSLERIGVRAHGQDGMRRDVVRFA